MTKFIAVSNRRGGVGKTTVTMMLAYGLSVGRRQKVLVVDLDAQASTSIVMMGHQRWRAAREAHRTTSALLTQIVSNDAIGCKSLHFAGDRRRSSCRWQRACARHHPERPRPRRQGSAADDRAAGPLPQDQRRVRQHAGSDGQDHPLGGWSLRSGRHRLRSGAFAAGVGRAARRRPRAHPLHSRSDGRGQRRLARAPAEGGRRGDVLHHCQSGIGPGQPRTRHHLDRERQVLRRSGSRSPPPSRSPPRSTTATSPARWRRSSARRSSTSMRSPMPCSMSSISLSWQPPNE